MAELDEEHQDFLGKYFKADTHYSRHDAPVAWLENSKNVTSKDIDSAMNHADPMVRLGAVKNPNATKENIDKALNDDEEYAIRLSAIRHSNATKENIDKALTDTHEYVRLFAAKHPNATKAHVLKALNDSDSYVRQNITLHANYKKYFPQGRNLY